MIKVEIINRCRKDKAKESICPLASKCGKATTKMSGEVYLNPVSQSVTRALRETERERGREISHIPVE